MNIEEVKMGCARQELTTNAAAADQPIIFTEAAAAKVAELIAEEGNSALKLRIAIKGGGCSGFQYDFSFDANQAEDDYAVTTGGVTLVIDAQSYPYMSGTRVDYHEGELEGNFVINNPHAKANCSCGSSFDMELE